MKVSYVVDHRLILSAITRTFRDLSDVEVADIERASALSKFGWRGGLSWDEVLCSQRVLLISEAGVGKTYECQAQVKRLRAADQPAFFLELGTLAGPSLLNMLDEEEVAQLDDWLRAPLQIATFFLDSIDELKLTRGSFRQALINVRRALSGQLGRTRIVITTRPVPFERELIEAHLPIPRREESEFTKTDFADTVMGRGWDNEKTKTGGEEPSKPWRNVGLMPLSREQQRQFAVGQNVGDPDALMQDIRERDAGEFAERPQDLIELCADWREHRRIRSHGEQVRANVETKLKPRTDRQERAELAQDKAFEGASRVALAAMLTRKLTLRYNAESDRVPASEPALDVSKLLLDWNADEQATLLERALFGFASYGRQRFHHRSVVEYLAAKRLDAMLRRGASIKAIKRLLFAETTQGTNVVRPSMRPVAAWIAAWHPTVFEDVVRFDPAVVLDYGDPQAVSVAQRAQALEAYVARYSSGGWRGLTTPSIQVHRFTDGDLAPTVTRLWERGIENGEVRQLLVRLVAAGRITGCADLAYAAAIDVAVPLHERILAIDALVRLADPHLAELSASIEEDPENWPPAAARRAMIELFPAHMPVERLKRIVDRSPDEGDSLSDLRAHPGSLDS